MRCEAMLLDVIFCVHNSICAAKIQKRRNRSCVLSYPRPGSNRHAFKGQGILSPSCLPIPPLRHLHKKSRFHSGPCGAENETRTRDPDLGKVVLYQLSYFRSSRAENETRTRDPDLGKVVLYQLSYFRLRIAVQKYNFFLFRKYF